MRDMLRIRVAVTLALIAVAARADFPPLEVFKGRNLYFGVREHSMGAEVNGITLYGSRVNLVEIEEYCAKHGMLQLFDELTH